MKSLLAEDGLPSPLGVNYSCEGFCGVAGADREAWLRPPPRSAFRRPFYFSLERVWGWGASVAPRPGISGHWHLLLPLLLLHFSSGTWKDLALNLQFIPLTSVTPLGSNDLGVMLTG